MNYDDWLEAPYQDAEARAEAIDSLAEHLLDGDYQPENIDNFLDAIDNGCLSGKDIVSKLEQAIAVGVSGYEAIGKVVWDAVYEYMADRANAEAVRRYNTRDFDDL